MLRKRWITIFCSAALACTCALMTGGLALSNVKYFNGEPDIHFPRNLRWGIWLAPRFTEIHIPFLFHYYGGGKPFGLRLELWDDLKQYRALEITSITVRYTDGQVEVRKKPWFRDFKAHEEYNSSTSGITKRDMFLLSDEIEGLVARHRDTKITLNGQLIKLTGETVPFEGSESFQARSRFKVTTFWKIIAGI